MPEFLGRFIPAFLCLFLLGCVHQPTSPASRILEVKMQVAETERSGENTDQYRTVETEIFLPAQPGSYPLIAFSHGAFASPDRYHALLRPIAEAGYIIVAPMHMDAEKLALDPKPSRARVWMTRSEDLAASLEPSVELRAELAEAGFSIDDQRVAVVGHSYGALIAQFAAGAIATDPDGVTRNKRINSVDALVAFSPPGPIPNAISAEGWSSISVPSLTLTGTADVFPGFVDDWRDHMASHDATPKGDRWLWVGEGVDHYFGGSFGRLKPVSAADVELLNNAIESTVYFLDLQLTADKNPSQPGSLPTVQFTIDD